MNHNSTDVLSKTSMLMLPPSRPFDPSIELLILVHNVRNYSDIVSPLTHLPRKDPPQPFNNPLKT